MRPRRQDGQDPMEDRDPSALTAAVFILFAASAWAWVISPGLGGLHIGTARSASLHFVDAGRALFIYDSPTAAPATWSSCCKASLTEGIVPVRWTAHDAGVRVQTRSEGLDTDSLPCVGRKSLGGGVSSFIPDLGLMKDRMVLYV